jgi:hypothetical protein
LRPCPRCDTAEARGGWVLLAFQREASPDDVVKE